MNKYKIRISGIIITLFLSIMFLNNSFFTFSPTIKNLLFASVGMVALLFVLLKRKFLNVKIIAVYLLLMLSFLMSYIYNRNADFSEILWIPSFIGIAYLITINLKRYKLFLIFLYIIEIYYIIFICLGFTSTHIVIDSSRNTISVLLLFYISLYIISSLSKSVEIKFLPFLLNVFICLWSMSRTGIIVSILLLIFVFIYRFQFNNYKVKNSDMKVAVICIVLFIVGIVIFKNEVLGVIERFKDEGLKTGRTDLWRDYLNETSKNFGNILFGANSSKIESLIIYSGNAHNSFIMLHSKFGLLGTSIVIIYIFTSMVKNFFKKNYILLLLTIIVCLRCFFDWIAFSGFIDIIFWIIIFNTFNRKRVD